MLSNKKKLFITIYCSWITLGCRRGYLHYKYTHEQKMKRYLEDKEKDPPKEVKGCFSIPVRSYTTKPEPFYYTNAALESFFGGGIVYFNPFFLPFTIFKELKRLEINLRNLEEDKKSSSYYEVF